MEVFLDQEIHGEPIARRVSFAQDQLLQTLVFVVQTTVAAKIGQWVKTTLLTLSQPTRHGL